MNIELIHWNGREEELVFVGMNVSYVPRAGESIVTWKSKTSAEKPESCKWLVDRVEWDLRIGVARLHVVSL